MGFFDPFGGGTGDAATVNGHTVNSDVPAGAEYTDTIYTFSEGTTNGEDRKSTRLNSSH